VDFLVGQVLRLRAAFEGLHGLPAEASASDMSDEKGEPVSQLPLLHFVA
jgi:hypothetical protein